MKFVEHICDDDLEQYAMRTLPAAESERLEEHVLICADCQDRLQAVDEYVAAMKVAAATKLRESGTGELGRCGRSPSSWMRPRPPDDCEAILGLM